MKVLIWVHILAFSAGMGAGMAMSQIGPRLLSATPDQRGVWMPLALAFDKITAGAVAILLVSGPLLLWLKYDWGRGLSLWFTAKMALVVLSVALIAVNKHGMARLRRGDDSGGRLMSATGPMISIVMFVLVLAAVFAFR